MKKEINNKLDEVYSMLMQEINKMNNEKLPVSILYSIEREGCQQKIKEILTSIDEMQNKIDDTL